MKLVTRMSEPSIKPPLDYCKFGFALIVHKQGFSMHIVTTYSSMLLTFAIIALESLQGSLLGTFMHCY